MPAPQLHDVMILESASGGRTALRTFLDLHPSVSMVSKSLSRVLLKEAADGIGGRTDELVRPHAHPLTVPPWTDSLATGLLIPATELPSGPELATRLRGLWNQDCAALQITRSPLASVLVFHRRHVVHNAWMNARGIDDLHPLPTMADAFESLKPLLGYDRHREQWSSGSERWRIIDFTDLHPDHIHETMRSVYAHVGVDTAITSELFTEPLVDMLGHWLMNFEMEMEWHDVRLPVRLERAPLLPLERAGFTADIARQRVRLPRMRGGEMETEIVMRTKAGPWFELAPKVRQELSRAEGPGHAYLVGVLLPLLHRAMVTTSEAVAEHCPPALDEALAEEVRTALAPHLTATFATRPELADRWDWHA